MSKKHNVVLRDARWRAVKRGEMRAILVLRDRGPWNVGDVIELSRHPEGDDTKKPLPIGLKITHVYENDLWSGDRVMISIEPMITGPNADLLKLVHYHETLTSVREIVDVEHPMSDGVRARLIALIDEALDPDIPE